MARIVYFQEETSAPGALQPCMNTEPMPFTNERIVAAARLEDYHEGRLGTRIYRYRRTDGSGLYVKSGTGEAGRDLRAERARLEWIKGKLPAPEIELYDSRDGQETLVLSEIRGTPSHLVKDPAAAARLAGKGLQCIHALDAAACPFQDVLSEELAEAERRTRERKLNLKEFSEATGGRSPEEVLRELQASRGMIRDLVFTHGDYCMPNVLLNGNRIAGFVDWGIAGVADLHRDLMAMSESITFNCGAEWLSEFYAAYGMLAPDPERIRYYTLLDAFFGFYEP